MKRLNFLVLTFILLFSYSFGNVAYAEKIHFESKKIIPIVIDDKLIIYNYEKYGKIVNSDAGRTLAPVRVLCESMDLEVNWNQKNKTATVIKKNANGKIVKKINFTVGQKVGIDADENSAKFGKTIVSFEVPAFINAKLSRLYLPLRAVAEALDYKISWEKAIKYSPEELKNKIDDKVMAVVVKTNNKYALNYKKPTIVDACGTYTFTGNPKNLQDIVTTENGRDLYVLEEAGYSGNPKDFNYNPQKDELIKALSDKWINASNNSKKPSMYFSGFTTNCIGGKNNIFVDFGRKDLSVLITRWSNSENAHQIFDDVLKLFLKSNEKAAQEIYNDIAFSINAKKAPAAADKWREIDKGIYYKAILIPIVVNSEEVYVPVIKVKLDYFWH